MMLNFKIILVLVLFLIVGRARAGILTGINIANNTNQSLITLKFNKKPIYKVFTLHNPERTVVDIYKSITIPELPLNFSKKNIIRDVRISSLTNMEKTRLVFELAQKCYIKATKKKIGKKNSFFLIKTKRPRINTLSYIKIKSIAPAPFPSIKDPFFNSLRVSEDSIKKIPSKKNPRKKNQSQRGQEPLIVAIDAGHGGQDPGAIGLNGLYEKNVTIAIALRLKILLDTDKMFRPVLTRNGDYFTSVMVRSEVARKKGANVLISIHADAAPNRSARGASVWVLSNRRANSEMATWSEQHEKQSELLGGAGDMLASNQADLYLSQAVLDLQFGHSQRVGYEIAEKVLDQLQRIGALHKHQPEHASLGVLRSPDIPSLLVETGFISNIHEEKLLSRSEYQGRIASALYLGLRAYFLENAPQNGKGLGDKRLRAISNAKEYHVVRRGETLFSISRQYGVNIEILQTLNKLKKDGIFIGKLLKIPLEKSTNMVKNNKNFSASGST